MTARGAAFNLIGAAAAAATLLWTVPMGSAAYGGAFVPQRQRCEARAPAELGLGFPAASEQGRGRRSSPSSSSLTMKVSKGKSRARRKDNSLAVLNDRRVKSAGRVGTKRYVDPTKVFIGNLPYEADEDDVLDFLSAHLGERTVALNVESVKIVRDWRTGRSRGYGFVTFLDPMMATSAMESLGGRELMGRAVNLSQGQKRKDPGELWVKKRTKVTAEEDEDGAVIGSALDEAEDEEGAEDVAGIDMLSLEDFDEADDLALFDEDGVASIDEEFEFDGVFEEVYKKELADEGEDETKTMNREQRREAGKGKKKRKLPHKGFG